jgi:hypothetical protein
MKAYEFVFAKTHGANRWRKSSPLANRDSENFYFAFAGGARPPLLLRFLRLPEILPSAPQIFPCPLALIFPLYFFSFFFPTSLLTKQLKNQKLPKK